MRELRVKGIYRHFKGDLYLVEDIAIHSETMEKFVVYRALYGDSELYVRSYNSFMGRVNKAKYPNVNQEYRFEFQEIKSAR